MPRPNRPRLTSGPHVGQEPIRTGNPPETQAHREDVAFGLPDWAVGRAWAGGLAAVLMTSLLVVAAAFLDLLPAWATW